MKNEREQPSLAATGTAEAAKNGRDWDADGDGRSEAKDGTKGGVGTAACGEAKDGTKGGVGTATCGEAKDEARAELKAFVEELEANIAMLDRLIERYGINRSLTNIRDSERAILKEKRKRL